MPENPRLVEWQPSTPIASEITLRDLFAGMAMQALLDRFQASTGGSQTTITREAYNMADEMLKERARKALEELEK